MKVGSAYVDIKARLDPLKKGLKAAHARVTAVAKRMGKALVLSLKVAGVAAAIATVKVLKDSVKAASDLQETTSKFETVFEDQMIKATKYAEILRQGYLMSTEESKRHLASMQNLFVPLGMASDKAADLSFEIVKLAADLGSFENMETSDVLRDITSAMVGNYETVRKYGSSLSATSVAQKALEMGLARTKEALTPVMKAQAAYQMILETNTAAIGDIARTSDGYANQMKQLNANWQDFLATVGTAFLPVLSKILKGINAWMKANEGLIKQKADEWATKLANAAKWVEENWDSVSVVFKLLAIDLKIMTTIWAAFGKVIVLTVGAIVKGFEKAKKVVQGFINIVKSALNLKGKMEMSGSPTMGFSDYMQYAKGKIQNFAAMVQSTKPVMQLQLDSSAVSAINDTVSNYDKRIATSLRLVAEAKRNAMYGGLGAGGGDIALLNEAFLRSRTTQLKNLISQRQSMSSGILDVAKEFGLVSAGTSQPSGSGGTGGASIYVENLNVSTFLDDKSTIREVAIKLRDEINEIGAQWGYN